MQKYLTFYLKWVKLGKYHIWNCFQRNSHTHSAL